MQVRIVGAFGVCFTLLISLGYKLNMAASDSTGPKKVLGVAILGAGLFAEAHLLPGLIANPRVEVVAVYSRSRKSAAALAEPHDLDIYSDDGDAGHTLYALLKRTDVQAVQICLPTYVHPEFIRRCLQAGKHVVSVADTVSDLFQLDSRLYSWQINLFPTPVKKLEISSTSTPSFGSLNPFCSSRKTTAQTRLGLK